MKYRTIEVKGKKFDIEIDRYGDTDYFSTVYESATLKAETFKQLQAKIAAAMSKSRVKLSIPFVRYGAGKIHRGEITGVHASNNNYLIRWEGKPGTEQEGGYYGAESYLRPDCAEELLRLSLSAEDARKALSAFTKANVIKARDEVTKQLEAATEPESETA